MRDYTKVSNSVWKSKKFRALKNDDARFAYLYILTGQHVNSAGCYDLPIPYACADLEWDAIRFTDSIERLCAVDLIRYDDAENTVLITQWFDHNEPMNPKHALSILTAIDQASSEALKREAFAAIEPIIIRKNCHEDRYVGAKISEYLEQYRDSISTGTGTGTQTETGTGTKLNGDLNLDYTREETRSPDRACAKGAALSALEEELPHRLRTSFIERAA